MTDEFLSPSAEVALNNKVYLTRLERLSKTSPESILVAAHELSHWIVGHHLGYLGDIEMNPEGYSRARTVFSGHISAGHLSIMLGAGAVDTPHSKAFGFGMDKFMINYLYRWSKIDFGTARESATQILAGYDFKVLERAAEIIGYFGNSGAKLSAETISDVLARARQELFWEGEKVNPLKKIKKLERKPAEEKDQLKRTVIEDKADFTRVIYYKGERQEAELMMCKLCRRPECKHIQDFKKRGNGDLKSERSSI